MWEQSYDQEAEAVFALDHLESLDDTDRILELSGRVDCWCLLGAYAEAHLLLPEDEAITVLQTVGVCLELTQKLIYFYQKMKIAREERRSIIYEATNLSRLLELVYHTMKLLPEEQECPEGLRALGVEDGPLQQYHTTLKRISARTQDGTWSRVRWLIEREEVQGFLSQMERLKSHINMAISLDCVMLLGQVLDKFYEVNNNICSVEQISSAGAITTQEVKDYASETRNIIEGEAAEKRTHIIAHWLSEAVIERTQEDLLNRRKGNTGQWFIESEQFQHWKSGRFSTLYCEGGPGVGKTMLSATMIQHLANELQHDTRLVYLYCDHKSNLDHSTPKFLRMLLRQLTIIEHGFPSAIERLYNRRGKASTPSESDLEATLVESLVTFRTTYVIIDALDECERRARSSLLSLIRYLRNTCPVQVLVTSREQADIYSEFYSAHQVRITSSREDLESYIQASFYELSRCVWRNTELKDQIVDAVVRASDQMCDLLRLSGGNPWLIYHRILLTKLHIDSLINLVPEHEIVERLRSLPSNFDTAWEETVSHVLGPMNVRADLARRVIYWVFGSKRPLSTVELRHAVAYDPCSGLPKSDRLAEIEDLLSFCGGLVVGDSKGLLSGTVKLAHTTLYEYFERSKSTWFPSLDFTMAQTCISYIKDTGMILGLTTADEEEDAQPPLRGIDKARVYFRLTTKHREFWRKAADFPFIWYAGTNWGTHLRELEKACCLTETTRLDFFTAIDNVQFMEISDAAITCEHYWKKHQLIVWWSWPPRPFKGQCRGDYFTTPLNFAAWFDLEFLAVCALTAMPPSRSPAEVSPLFIAAHLGSTRVVDAMLNRAGDQYSRNRMVEPDGYTALLAAARQGKTETVEALIADGVAIDAMCTLHNETPLMEASEGGHKQAVRMLLQAGADCTLEDVLERSAFTRAIQRNELAIVEMLWATGKYDINGRDSHGVGPLAAAAAHGSDKIVEFLLTLQATQLNGAADILWTPSSIPSKYLDINILSMMGETPLAIAAAHGHDKVVRILLGAPSIIVDSKDVRGQTPLTGIFSNHCYTSGHLLAAKLVLDSGKANANGRNKARPSPLWYAVWREDQAANTSRTSRLGLLRATGKVDLSTEKLTEGELKTLHLWETFVARGGDYARDHLVLPPAFQLRDGKDNIDDDTCAEVGRSFRDFLVLEEKADRQCSPPCQSREEWLERRRIKREKRREEERKNCGDLDIV